MNDYKLSPINWSLLPPPSSPLSATNENILIFKAEHSTIDSYFSLPYGICNIEDFYEYYINNLSGSNECNCNEVINYNKTSIRPFLIITYPFSGGNNNNNRQEKQIIYKRVDELIYLFKYHLVDCEFVKSIEDIEGTSGFNNCYDNEIVFRIIFDCGKYRFENMSLFVRCLEMFKLRILSDSNKNSKFIEKYSHNGRNGEEQPKEIYDQEEQVYLFSPLKFVIKTEFIPKNSNSNSNNVFLNLEMFASFPFNNKRLIYSEFLPLQHKENTFDTGTATTTTKWIHFNLNQMRLNPLSNLNSIDFPISKDEFNTLLITNMISAFTPLKTSSSTRQYNINSISLISHLKTISAIESNMSRYLNPVYFHYLKDYDFNKIWSLFGNPLREVVFVYNDVESTADPVYQRKLFFANVNEFKTYVLRKIPTTIHFGPIYNDNPRKNESARPIEKELVFDIDLNDYYVPVTSNTTVSKYPFAIDINNNDNNTLYRFIKQDLIATAANNNATNTSNDFPTLLNIRECCRSEKKACKKCWRLALFAAQFLNHVLTTMYGFKKVVFSFSGRRGIHCVVFDECVKQWNSKQRKSLIDLFDRRNCIQDYPVFNEVFAKFAEPVFKDILVEQGKTVQNEFDRLTKKFPLLMNTDRNRSAIMFLLWPRFDVGVTIQFNHLIKSPLCLHPDTKKICEIFTLDNNNNNVLFNPFAAITK